MTSELFDRLRRTLTNYAAAAAKKFGGVTSGEPEDQLRAPFETLLVDAAAAMNTPVGVRGEVRLPGIGKPDYAVTDPATGLPLGYAELKAPGGGVVKSDLDTRSKKQFDRFLTLGNVLYCDGSSFALYQDGRKVRHLKLDADVTIDGKAAIGDGDGERFFHLLRDFLHWEPTLPPRLTARKLADLLAPLCRFLRGEFNDAMDKPGSHVRLVADQLKTRLFPDAEGEQIADAYA